MIKRVKLKFALTSILCLFQLSFSWAQNRIISIVDENGDPLVGVNVVSEDGEYQSISNNSGLVELFQLEAEDCFIFSYIGYQNQRICFEDLPGEIRLLPAVEDLQTILVVGRRDDQLDELPFQVERLDQARIALTNPQTTADILSKDGALYVQKSQMGGGSPVIRGFEANRVLLVVDGVRMNNAIYRSGHLQNAITLDPAILQQMEVIYGPGSLVYGSDALGGVIHFRTRDPSLLGSTQEENKKVGISANSFLRYASANQENTAHFDFNVATRRWAFLTSLSKSDFGHLRAGNRRPEEFPDFGLRTQYVTREKDEDVVVENEDPDLQLGTAYSQFDLLQKVRFQANDSLYFVANFQLSNSSDIPRYDRLIERRNGALRFAEWYYGPQFRLMGSVKTRILKPTQFYDRATLISAFQRIEEDRFERRLFSNWREANLAEVQVLTFTADFDKFLTSNRLQRLSYGLDVGHNKVGSLAWREDIQNGEQVFDVNTRYPSQGSQLSSWGAYLNYHWKNTDERLHLQAGLRLNQTLLKAKFGANDPIQWPDNYLQGITGKNEALTWALGLTYNSPSRWQLRLLGATAFRAPNIDDFGKFRENDGFLLIPNPDLGPEKSLNIETTLAKNIGTNSENWQLKLSATAFYTRLQDAIVREDFLLPDGNSFFVSQADTFFVQANINAQKTNIYGLSGNLQLEFAKFWQLKSSLNFTQGRRSLLQQDNTGKVVLDTLVPQDHIPPIYGRSSLQFKKNKWTAELAIQYNGAKKVRDYAVSGVLDDPNCGLVLEREGTADNIELGVVQEKASDCHPHFLGVYAWTNINFYLSFQLNSLFTLNGGIENVADIHYRSFASGVSAPGRNVILALRGHF